jgi:nitrite reductase (NADH) small subunit
MNNQSNSRTTTEKKEINVWFKVAREIDFPENGGACVKYKDEQIAVFHFQRRKEWYACQNLCPHKKQMILSRGLTGSQDGEPKVACPFHKKTFSLTNGICLNAEEESISVFPVKVEDGFVYIGFHE